MDSKRTFLRRVASVRAGAVVIGLLAAAVCRGQSGQSEEVRTWTDSSGLYKVKASLVQQDKDSVRLKRTDGKVIEVPLDRLSKEDVQYVRSLATPDPFQPASGDGAQASEAAVLVVAAGGDQSFASPGIVFKRDQDRAYVVTDRLRNPIASLPPIRGGTPVRPAEPEDLTYSVIWYSASGQRKVKAERFSASSKSSQWILAAPAKDMPAPLTDAKTPVRNFMPVCLFGWQIRQSGPKVSFARATAEGKVTRVFRNEEGNVNTVEVEGDSLRGFSWAVVTTAEGAPIGYTEDRRSRDPSEQTVLPISRLASLDEPKLLGVNFAPKSGDASSIEFEFVAFVEDPFETIESAELRVRLEDKPATLLPREVTPEMLDKLPPGTVAPEVLDELRKQVEAAARARAAGDKEAVLKLARRKPSEQVAGQLALTSESPGVSTWVASHTAPNPGNADPIRFAVRFSHKMRDGTGVQAAEQIIAFFPDFARARSAGRGRAVVDIPGLDGLPTDMPRPVQHKDGGWVLTSDVTRVKSTPKHKPAAPFPKPQRSGQSRAGTESSVQGIKRIGLAVAAKLDDSFARELPLMVFSPDGKWLYLVDGKQVLRKIGTEDLREDAFLETGGGCTDLSLCKAGILLAVGSVNGVWVVDPETLEVLREVPVRGLRLVAGSPATSLGVALGAAPFMGVSQVQMQELQLIDFAKGSAVHRIRSRYRGRVLSPGGVAPLEDYLLAMRMSRDGKYLFTCGRSIHRFRLDGEDLIYETLSPQLHGGVTTHFVLSSDDRWVAMPTGGGNPGRKPPIGSYLLAVLDAKQLATPKLWLEIADHPQAIGFDPKTGNMYAPSDEAMGFFGPRGAKILEVPLSHNEVRRIEVHPGGERFVVWAQDGVTWYDVRGAAALKPSQP